MMHVKLLRYTPEPDRTVAMSARLCYSPIGAAELENKMTDQEVASLVRRLGQMGHTSTFEHVSFTFAIEGVSRSLLAQITRHRIASFSVQSQRYVREKAFEYVLPPAIAEDPHCREIFEKAMAEDQRLYDELAAALTERQAARLEEQGMAPEEARKTARKMANEDARFVLPNACCTKMMMTMDTRSLYNFFRLRCCNRAQWEIRELAWTMLELCRRAAPTLFEKAGPACLCGACPEGKMSCGKTAEVRERSLNL